MCVRDFAVLFSRLFPGLRRKKRRAFARSGKCARAQRLKHRPTCWFILPHSSTDETDHTDKTHAAETLIRAIRIIRAIRG